MIYRRLRLAALLVAMLIAAGSVIPPQTAHASFNKDLIMDDTVFEDSASMSAGGIDAFLNGFPSSCISPNSGFRTPDPQGWSAAQSKYLFGGNVTAGQAIYNTAQLYHVNPQVILATMQKEQSVVSGGAGCYPNEPNPASATPMTNACGSGTRNCTLACTHAGGCMNIAMGYGCPGYCDAKNEGFSMQLTLGTWLLRFGQQRSQGNLTGYVGYEAGDEYFTYTGPMTPGNRQRSNSSSTVYYDGSYTTVNGVGVSIGSGATATLYNFTPFTSGNQSFVNIFEGWFGGTVSSAYYSCHNATNVSGAASGQHAIPVHERSGAKDSVILTLLNNTGSACAETHMWSDSFQNWTNHTATNHPAVDPADAEIISANYDTSGKSLLYLVKYRNTGSGMIEIHGWDTTNQRWVSHVATNHPAVDPADSRVISADLNGDGRSEFVLVKYQHNGSGRIEIHEWAGGQQSWVSHIVTSHPELSTADAEVIGGHPNGGRADQLFLVKYQNNGSGRIEIHEWAGGQQSWVSHMATNHPSLSPADNRVIATDFNGDGRSEFTLVKYRGTGSGRVEVHSWTTDLQNWISHIVTNMPQF